MIAVSACAISPGCAGSRWAKSDAEYAGKYRHHSDNPLQMAKQSMDARFIGGRGGVGASTALGTAPGTLAGQLTAFQYVGPSVEMHGGLVGLAGTGDSNLFGGVTAGGRLQTPTRLAPFIGIGAVAATGERDVSEDGLDNDYNFLVDEPGEDLSEYFASVYPEVGAHFWLTPRVRMTASAAYHVTSTGRDDDQWLFGIGLSLLSRGDYAVVPDGKFSLLERPESWQSALDDPHDSRDYSALPPTPSSPRPTIERTADGRPLPPF